MDHRRGVDRNERKCSADCVRERVADPCRLRQPERIRADRPGHHHGDAANHHGRAALERRHALGYPDLDATASPGVTNVQYELTCGIQPTR